MIDIDRIPAEQRWRLAAQILTTLPLAYNWALRDSIGAAYPHLEQVIFKEVARDALKLADTAHLPHTRAGEIADTLNLLSAVIFGPEFQGDVLEKSRDSVMIRLSSCPFITVAREMRIEPERAYTICSAYSKTMVEALNSEFTLKNRTALCMGAPFCEKTIERRDERSSAQITGSG